MKKKLFRERRNVVEDNKTIEEVVKEVVEEPKPKRKRIFKKVEE